MRHFCLAYQSPCRRHPQSLASDIPRDQTSNQLPRRLQILSSALMPAPLPATATFCNVPVSAVFDSTAAASCISLDWIMNAGLRTRHSRASGLLTLPSSSGVISVSIQDVPVVASLPSDLVLGVDWFQFLCGSDSGSEVIVYLSSGPLELRRRLVPLTQETEAPLPTGMLQSLYCSYHLFIYFQPCHR
jgi:hypothetical protein